MRLYSRALPTRIVAALSGCAIAGVALVSCADDTNDTGDTDMADTSGETGGDADEHTHDDDGEHAHDDDHADDHGGDDFGHVHGLGVDGDTLYIATHHGLFTWADGELTRSSEDDHDFMGFTMVDDTTFLASGHPNSRDDLPANLGLLESTDNGQTWETLSLSGEVDFHALDAKHDVIFGFDSGTAQLMRSDDGENWDSLGQVPMADLTISPDEPDTVLVTTEDGPRRSTDAGQSFELVADGAHVLLLIDWPRPDELYGVGPQGVVHHSADGGDSWEERADLGERPQAMTVAPDGSIYVALQRSIVVSDDGGESFSDVYTW
ncbi:exo-alpha-sialidase [Actinobacteria bacterium YIM 96077]|nr:exo-alpha-sialidase [Phytoactinopolyspora halophila]AYY13652.1 exo-alpha-sialidase [Actinobacteria bacterium YIM 96077]